VALERDNEVFSKLKTFHDTDPSQMTHHGDDDSVAIKTLKPSHMPNRVSIISHHITTILATLPTFQQPYPKQKKKIRRPNRCMPLYAIFHSNTRQLVSPFVTSYPHMWRDSHHMNFIPIVLQPSTGILDLKYQRVSPWSNPTSLQSL
jgi:hypothetical protein